MLYITRYATERMFNRYTLCVDEEYIQKLNDGLKKWFILAEDFKPVTIEDIQYIFKRVSNREDEKIKRKDSQYEAYLTDVVYEWVSDDLWQCDYDVVDGETIDWEDEVSED